MPCIRVQTNSNPNRDIERKHRIVGGIIEDRTAKGALQAAGTNDRDRDQRTPTDQSAGRK